MDSCRCGNSIIDKSPKGFLESIKHFAFPKPSENTLHTFVGHAHAPTLFGALLYDFAGPGVQNLRVMDTSPPSTTDAIERRVSLRSRSLVDEVVS
jgi:hypothetical protein